MPRSRSHLRHRLFSPPKAKRDDRTRRDIQGLRAFAVVAVIADHLVGWPEGGFIGVDVFFVLSGFLITGLLLREHEKTGRISFRGFYRRRVKRIMPALLLVLAFSVVTSWLIFSAGRWRTTVVDAVWSLFFAGNWRFALQSTDYFQQDRPLSPLQHYWSLGVEEQFYLVWPWLLVLVFALLARAGGSRFQRHAAAAVIALVSIGSFGWAVHESTAAAERAYFSTFSRTWELGIGALLAVAAPLLSRLPAALRPALAWVGLVGMLASLVLVTPQSSFPAPAALLPVLSTALVVVAGTGIAQQRYLAPLTNRVSGYVGDLSYSLYLWHFPVIVLGTVLLGDTVMVRVVLGAALVLLAVYSYHLVEDPLRRANWDVLSQRHRRRRQLTAATSPTFSPAYALTLLSLVAVLTAGLTVAAILKPMTLHSANLAVPALPAAPASPASEGDQEHPERVALQAEITRSLGARQWPKTSPAMDDVIAGSLSVPEINWCGLHTVIEDRCTWGDPDAEHTMVTVGNSLSVAYVEALRSAIGTDGNWKLTMYGMYGCPFRDPSVTPLPDNAPDGCADRQTEVLSAINESKPDVVVLTGLAYLDAVKAQLDKIEVETRLVFMPGPPEDKDIRSCYSKVSSPSDCVSTVWPEWAGTERAAARDLNGVYVDSREWFCYRNQCPSFVGRIPVRADLSHITPQYAERIAPVIREQLVEQGVIELERD